MDIVSFGTCVDMRRDAVSTDTRDFPSSIPLVPRSADGMSAEVLHPVPASFIMESSFRAV